MQNQIPFLVPMSKIDNAPKMSLPCPFSPQGMLQPRHMQPPPMFGPRGSTIPPRHMGNYQPRFNRQQSNQSRFNNQQHGSKPYQPRPRFQNNNTRLINTSRANRDFWCEPCDRDFQSITFLQEHKAEHQKCGIDGCKYEGHELMVTKHIQMQHSSGLFDKIKNLSTPEDIQKWREERKKRYPTKENVELRQQAQTEKSSRGERLEEPKNRFGSKSDRRTGSGGTQSNRQDDKSKIKPQRKRKRCTKKKSTLPNNLEAAKVADASAEGLVNQGSSTLQRFKGTGCMEDYRPAKKIPIVQNALSSLLGMYASGDDTDYESDETGTNEPEVLLEISSGTAVNTNESPLQDKINSDIHIDNNSLIPSEIDDTPREVGNKLLIPSEIDDKPSEIPVDRVDNVITSPETTKIIANHTTKGSKQKKETDAINRRKFRQPTVLDLSKKYRNQNTMLEKLLQKEIRHERNVLLQCVRYVVKNKFFGLGPTETVATSTIIASLDQNNIPETSNETIRSESSEPITILTSGPLDSDLQNEPV